MTLSTKVTIVIVTWNKQNDVLNLLESLFFALTQGTKVIVVDNASSDGTEEAIRNLSFPVHLIVNSENLGGSGGFNTGLRYALENFDQKYIWLLDNDAEVTEGTLDRMFEVMEEDSSIGVAGSCILDPGDRDLIIETGGFVDFRAGNWKPHRRYQRIDDLNLNSPVEDVDYVPACSALARCDALRQVGLLDERFFLHWDDVDLCVRVRNAGYRIVSVLDAKAFHGAEKGHSPLIIFYDFRNSLLFFAKNSVGFGFLKTLAKLLPNYMMSVVYFYLLGSHNVARFLYSGFSGFLKGEFGRASATPDMLKPERDMLPVEEASELKTANKLIVFAVGSYDDVMGAVKSLKSVFPHLSIGVAASVERAEAYQCSEVDEMITFDLLTDSLFEKLKVAWRIWRGGYRFGINAGNVFFLLPYAFLMRRNFVYDSGVNSLAPINVSFLSFWKIPVTIIVGYLWAIASVVPVLMASKKYRENRVYD